MTSPNSPLKIYSLFQAQPRQLQRVLVEASLSPGLPAVHIMGLPDQAIRESILRVKSALRAQGYKWPRTQQLLINLRPAFVRKKSTGLDLALALAILKATGQLKLPPELQIGGELLAYGELSLTGDCSAPADLNLLALQPEILSTPLLTGQGAPPSFTFPHFWVESLSQLKHLKASKAEEDSLHSQKLTPPPLPDLHFPLEALELLKVLATGEHHCLLAGAMGSGKTTLAEALWPLLRPPGPVIQGELSALGLDWRPLASPHHSTTPLALIGGGSPIFPGVIAQAHQGLLILDEFLEFHPRIQEALREPLETGQICISRRGESQSFPSRFMLLATTNLCPCGQLTPGQNLACSYSLQRCRSYFQRLSGPILDRFDILAFSSHWLRAPKHGENSHLPLSHILEELDLARQIQDQRGQQERPNSRLELSELRELTDPLTYSELLPEVGGLSQRRLRALLRVARSGADLDQSPLILGPHIEKALPWTLHNFTQLRQLFA